MVICFDNRRDLKGVSRCSMRIRKAKNSNVLIFKFEPSLLPKFLSSLFACGDLKYKRMKPMLKCSKKADGKTLINYKASCQKTTSKCMPEWVDEQSDHSFA